MLCPECKKELQLNALHNPTNNFVLKYRCNYCGISFERHIFTNNLGLVQMDKLFEMNVNGLILKEWK